MVRLKTYFKQENTGIIFRRFSFENPRKAFSTLLILLQTGKLNYLDRSNHTVIINSVDDKNNVMVRLNIDFMQENTGIIFRRFSCHAKKIHEKHFPLQ